MDIIVCLSLIGYCLMLKRFSNWSIEHTPFFVISCTITLLYCFAYWNFLKLGTDAILILGSFLFILSPFYLWDKKKYIFEKYVTPGFVISIGFITLFLYFANQAHLSKWDEFTQWGPHSKLVFLNNGFVKENDVTIFKSYPLGGALFQYLFFRLPGFNEGSAYLAQCLLIMAPLSIFIQKYKWHAWKKAFTCYAVVLALLSLFNVQIGPTDSLYMDDAVGVYFGMSMIAYFASRKDISSILYLIPIIATLSMLKYKLYPLILAIGFVLFIDQVLSNNKNLYSKSFLLKILAILTLFITAWLVTYSWDQYLIEIGTSQTRQLNLNLIQIKNALFSPDTSIAHTILFNYLHNLGKAFTLTMIIFLINIFTYCLYQEKNDRVNFAIISIALFLGLLAYIFGLLLMYLFTFVTYEAVHLASMYRYLNIYFLAWSLVTLYFLFDAAHHVKNSRDYKIIKYFTPIFIIVLFGFLSLYFIHQYNIFHRKNNAWQLRQPIIKIANAVKKLTKPDDKIFTIWQNSAGFERAMLVYELTPRKPNLGCSSFGKAYTKNDIWTCDINKKQLQQELGQYDYLLLGYIDQNFWKHYQSIIPTRRKLEPLAAYNICINNEFNSFGKPNCRIQQHHAYLFKIIKKDGHVQLKNIF